MSDLRDCEMTPLQKTLVAFAQESAGVRSLSLSDSFLAIEDASIAAIRLTVRIEEQFSVEFPLTAVFDSPTLGDLAAELQRVLDQSAGQPP